MLACSNNSLVTCFVRVLSPNSVGTGYTRTHTHTHTHTHTATVTYPPDVTVVMTLALTLAPTLTLALTHLLAVRNKRPRVVTVGQRNDLPITNRLGTTNTRDMNGR